MKKKILRQARLIIQSHSVWCRSLDDVERANIETITKLIETGEVILASERQAWITAEKKNADKEIEGESESASSNTNKTSVSGAHGTLRQKRARVAPLS
jgi:hypothetical protein